MARHGYAVTVAVATVGLVTGACSGQKQFRPLAVGDPAPAYSVVTMHGDSVALASLSGRAVLLNVWATWCVPCRTEMPAIQRLYTQFADSGLTVIAVSVDDPGADAAVQQFIRTYGIGFTVARDPSKRVSRTFRTIGVPETFLLDRRGRIAKRWIGEFDATSEAVKTAVREAVNG